LSPSDTPGERWALRGRRLYLCTPNRPDLERFVDACLDGGVDVVQLRDKTLSDGETVRSAGLLARVCAGHDAPLVVNDRPDLAAEAGADGVHVGQDDAPAWLARRILGPGAIVGLSTHGPDDLAGAASEDVTYISAGPVEPTPTKPGREGTGLGYVSLASARATVPVFVTGGVTPEKIPTLAGHGVRHFVVVRYLTQAPDPTRAARSLRDAIDRALSSEPPAA
jgi:thiamine-phosphate pyrophosphorylase